MDNMLQKYILVSYKMFLYFMYPHFLCVFCFWDVI